MIDESVMNVANAFTKFMRHVLTVVFNINIISSFICYWLCGIVFSFYSVVTVYLVCDICNKCG